MKKIQDYTLLLIIITSLILGILMISNWAYELGTSIIILAILFFIALIKQKFVDFILFFTFLAGLSISIVMLIFNSQSDKAYSAFPIITSFFIFFILWKDNFFTKEPRNNTPDQTREMGKRMLNKLREMGPDESMVGKTVIKKASVKKEEDKNSTKS